MIVADSAEIEQLPLRTSQNAKATTLKTPLLVFNPVAMELKASGASPWRNCACSGLAPFLASFRSPRLTCCLALTNGQKMLNGHKRDVLIWRKTLGNTMVLPNSCNRKLISPQED